VDAAKHIGQDDLDGIYSRLNKTKDGVKLYWALEVGGSPGILPPEAFTRSGDAGSRRGEADSGCLQSYQGSGSTGSLATLEVFGRDRS
jgi:alpha-amylase